MFVTGTFLFSAETLMPEEWDDWQPATPGCHLYQLPFPD